MNIDSLYVSGMQVGETFRNSANWQDDKYKPAGENRPVGIALSPRMARKEGANFEAGYAMRVVPLVYIYWRCRS